MSIAEAYDEACGQGKGYYSLGLCGYEMWLDPEDNNRMMLRFVDGENEKPRKSYAIRHNKSGRPFVCPYGRKIYLDQVMRA